MAASFFHGVEVVTVNDRADGAVSPVYAFSGLPAITPSSGDTATTFTAADPDGLNLTITSRQWLLGSTILGTGASIVPGAGNTGRLTRKIVGTAADGTTLSVTSGFALIAAVVPTPDNTYANSTQVYANASAFSPALIALQQRLVALGITVAGPYIDFGTGPDTPTGDTLYAALMKLQAIVAAAEAAIPAPTFSGNPAISPSSGDTSTTFTATDPTVTGGAITARQWLLGSNVIGTGTTVVTGAGATGQLTRKVTAVSANGTSVSVTSTAVTVSAVEPAPTAFFTDPFFADGMFARA